VKYQYIPISWLISIEVRKKLVKYDGMSFKNAIKRALNCEVNQFGGIVLASEMEHNAYLRLVSALAPYYRYRNYRDRMDGILVRFTDTKGERFSSNSPKLRDMANDINNLLNDIKQDSTIA